MSRIFVGPAFISLAALLSLAITRSNAGGDFDAAGLSEQALTARPTLGAATSFVVVTNAAVTGMKPRCNQGVGNGAEGCDPGNSNHRNPSNDENGGSPGQPGRKP